MIAHRHTNHMAKLPILDLLKITCSIEWSVDEKLILAARKSNRRKTQDTGGFLRLFRRVLVETTLWATDHAIPHHRKPLFIMLETLKEGVCVAKLSISCVSERK